jgi:hypothetical protein
MDCYPNQEQEDMDNASNASSETAHVTPIDCSATNDAPPTTAPKSESKLQFTPSVLNVKDGKTPFSITPIELVQGVTLEDLSAGHLSLERFRAEIEMETGSTSLTHWLLAEVPDQCGRPGDIRDMKNKKVWRAEMQRCHNAGWQEVRFEVRSKEKGDDDVLVQALVPVPRAGLQRELVLVGAVVFTCVLAGIVNACYQTNPRWIKEAFEHDIFRRLN